VSVEEVVSEATGEEVDEVFQQMLDELIIPDDEIVYEELSEEGDEELQEMLDELFIPDDQIKSQRS